MTNRFKSIIFCTLISCNIFIVLLAVFGKNSGVDLRNFHRSHSLSEALEVMRVGIPLLLASSFIIASAIVAILALLTRLSRPRQIVLSFVQWGFLS
jgi:hypothetical protein